MRDYYEVLGVSPDAGADEIKRAYRQLARRYHPDISGEDRAGGASDVARAYEVLREPDTHREDDQRLALVLDNASASVLDNEIAIDFPSVTAVLDRMRHAFFGDSTLPPCSTQIVLSPQEAFRGARVRLHLPVKRTCSHCGGRGEVWGEWCSACGGTGDRPGRHRVHLRVPAGVHEGTRVRLRVAGAGLRETTVDAVVVIR